MGSPSRSTLPIGSNDDNIRPVPKRLHYIIAGCVVPNLSLGLALSIINPSPWVILALVFSLFSSVFSLYRTRKTQTYEYQIRLPGDDQQEQQSKSKNDGLFATADFVLAGGMFSWVVLSFIESSGNWLGAAVHFFMAYVGMVWLAQRYVLI